MRDLLNLIDNIAEGVGLANRKPGETFKNKVGDVVTFQGIEFYPESGKFPPDDTMSNTIANLKSQGINIHWVNQAAANSGGFMIATFTGEDGRPYYLGKFIKEISPNRAQNNFAHNNIPGEFTFQGNLGQKENSGLKPSEWLTQYQNNTPDTILQQVVTKFGENSDEANALRIFINSDIPCEIPRGNMNAEAFRDYFAEVLQPIALVMGKKVDGNANEAAALFFGGGGYSDCTISFNSNTIGGLYDSLLVNPDGRQIKLSSKGKDGASASVANLEKAVRELESVPAGQQLLTKYADEIDILNTIKREGHFGAPLALAQQFNLINASEAAQVMALKNFGPNDVIIGAKLLSPRLEKMYQSRSNVRDRSRIIPIEHMISAIAYPVANIINSKTKFGEAASTILNNAALVQMYTYTTATADKIRITKLEARYPSEAVTDVLLDANKVYFSTGGKGNYTFTILKNGATKNDVNPMDPLDSLETPPELEPGEEGPEFKRSDVRPGKTKSDKIGTTKSLGRKRR